VQQDFGHDCAIQGILIFLNPVDSLFPFCLKLGLDHKFCDSCFCFVIIYLVISLISIFLDFENHSDENLNFFRDYLNILILPPSQID